MNKQLSLKTQQLFQRISDSSLVEILFDQASMSLKLVFSFEGFSGGAGHEVVLSINHMITLTLTPPVNDTLPYLVTNATLTIIEQGEGLFAFRIHIEGALEIQTDARHIQLYEEVHAIVE